MSIFLLFFRGCRLRQRLFRTRSLKRSFWQARGTSVCGRGIFSAMFLRRELFRHSRKSTSREWHKCSSHKNRRDGEACCVSSGLTRCPSLLFPLRRPTGSTFRNRIRLSDFRGRGCGLLAASRRKRKRRFPCFWRWLPKICIALSFCRLRACRIARTWAA